MPKPDNKPLTGKIYSYLRFSTPEQQLGDSERRQLELAQKFAEDRGTTLDETLVDRGLSGYHAAHKTKGHLGRFLEKVERGQIPPGSTLVIENVDRLSREPIMDALSTVSDLLKKGISIQTLSPREHYDQKSLNGGMIYALIGQMQRAHDESKRKSERITAARDQARKLARQEGKIVTSQCPAWLKVSPQKTFEVIPEAAVAIQRIYDLKLQGMGYHSIAKMLNTESGWKPPGGNGWRDSYVKKILQYRAVIGEYQPHHQVGGGKRIPVGTPIPDYYPAIVDTDTFYALHKQFESNRGKGGRVEKASNLFVHLVKCAYCGGSMAFIDKCKPPKGHRRLVCDNARRGHKCTAHRIGYGEAERTILANCQGLKPEQVLPDPDEQTKQIQSLRLKLQGITGSLETIEPQIGTLVNRVSQATSESLMARYEAKIGELEEQKEQLADQQTQIGQELKQLLSTQKSFTKWKKGLKTLIKSLDDITIRLKLRLHLRELIERIDVYPVGFTEVYDSSKDTSLARRGEEDARGPDPVTIPDSFVNTEITGNLLREMMIEVVAEEKPEGMQIEDLEALVKYVESQCMSKRGRFYRVFFQTGSWIDLVPEGSLARGWKLVEGKWELVNVDFKPLMAEFSKSRKRSRVRS